MSLSMGECVTALTKRSRGTAEVMLWGSTARTQKATQLLPGSHGEVPFQMFPLGTQSLRQEKPKAWRGLCKPIVDDLSWGPAFSQPSPGDCWPGECHTPGVWISQPWLVKPLTHAAERSHPQRVFSEFLTQNP